LYGLLGTEMLTQTQKANLVESVALFDPATHLTGGDQYISQAIQCFGDPIFSQSHGTTFAVLHFIYLSF
jgi:hypothetical protein